MNEEEITERIKDLIHTCDLGIQQHGTYDDLFELDKTALEGILDLYKQEKEKNKKLEDKQIWNKGRIEELKKELAQEKEKNKELEATLKQTQDSWFEDTQKIEQLKLNDNDLQEKLKIATAMLTKGTYPEKNEGDNDFNKKFIAVDKIKEMKEFYINEYKNKNITLIPLANIIKNINVLLEGK